MGYSNFKVCVERKKIHGKKSEMRLDLPLGYCGKRIKKEEEVKKKMLFMAIFTWEPEKRDEVVKRRTTEEIPKEMELIGEWNDLGRGRVFRLFEVDDPGVILRVSFDWNDLGDVELVPVMETKAVLELLEKTTQSNPWKVTGIK